MPSPSRPNSGSFFPSFLLPSIPFRRRSRQDSSDSSASADSAASANSVPQPNAAPAGYLSGHAAYLRCARCSTDVCLTSQVVSKGFTGRHGRAYLVSPSESATAATSVLSLPNTHTHNPVPRQLVTGAHTVSDISCLFCGSVLGWKYVAAEDEAQRYKVGKYILETKRVRAAQFWDDGEGANGHPSAELPMPPVELKQHLNRSLNERDVEFDSQDEDECEDLFMGVWTPALAMKRRKGKRFLRPRNESYE